MNFQETIFYQFSKSQNLLRLIYSICSKCGLGLKDNFIKDVFDINTAKGYGLDIWGKIVGLGRGIPVNKDVFFDFYETGDFHGFAEAYPNSAPFYQGYEDVVYIPMTDKFYRSMLFIKAYANISNSSLTSLNNILMRTVFTLYGYYTQKYAFIDYGRYPLEDGTYCGFYYQDFIAEEYQLKNYRHGSFSKKYGKESRPDEFGFSNETKDNGMADKPWVTPFDLGILYDPDASGSALKVKPFHLWCVSNFDIPEPIKVLLKEILPITSGCSLEFKVLKNGA